MTRSDQAAWAYHDDFFTWTQDQAAALRRLGACGGIDVAHLAAEFEDLGRRDLREVRSHLRRLIAHLLKIDAEPNTPSVPHWRLEARTFSRSASDAFTLGMRRLIDVADLWTRATKALVQDADDLRIPAPRHRACPFTLDDLLSDALDVDAALAKMANNDEAPR